MSRLNNKKGSSLNFADFNDDEFDEDDDSVSDVDPEELQKMLEVRKLKRKLSNILQNDNNFRKHFQEVKYFIFTLNIHMKMGLEFEKKRKERRLV